MVDGCRSKHVNVVSGVAQGYVWTHYCSSSELFTVLENKLIGYADNSTLIAIEPSPVNRVTVAEFLNRDLGKFIVV